MTAVLPALRVGDAAPEMARRLGLIVAGLVALVARRFLRDPKFHTLILPLCAWLGRTMRRFGRVRAVAVVRPAVPAVARTAAVARVRLPSRRGWLVRELGWEAAGFGCQLEALLGEPEMVALLARLPAVGRVLRPLGRMLGVTVGPVVAKPVVVRKPRARRPRVKRAPAWRPGPIRPFWVAGGKIG